MSAVDVLRITALFLTTFLIGAAARVVAHEHTTPADDAAPREEPFEGQRQRDDASDATTIGSCVMEARALEDAKADLARQLDALRADESILVGLERGDWPETTPVELTPERFEAAMREHLERRGIRGLEIDCSAHPCLVLGAGRRTALEPLAASLQENDVFEPFRAVIVSRVVTRGAGDVDTVSALALEPEGTDSDLAEVLQTRLARLQD